MGEKGTQEQLRGSALPGQERANGQAPAGLHMRFSAAILQHPRNQRVPLPFALCACLCVVFFEVTGWARGRIALSTQPLASRCRLSLFLEQAVSMLRCSPSGTCRLLRLAMLGLGGCSTGACWEKPTLALADPASSQP